MKHLDLFSGIGGFALAAERVWPNVEHIFVEIDPFCQAVLEKHWPTAYIHDDIRTFTYPKHNGFDGAKNAQGNRKGKNGYKARQEKLRQLKRSDSLRTPVNLLTGGFPCQPFSNAGRKRGAADDRHLWPEMLRVIKEFQPTWIIGENVAGIVNMVLEQTCLDLEAEGYEVWPIIIPAVAVNAPHRRDRVWIVAYKHVRGHQRLPEWTSEGQGSGHQRRTSDAADPRRERQEVSKKQTTGCEQRDNWERNWFEVAAELCRVDDGLPKRLDRNPRIKALGNAIVPQVAEEIMKAIAKNNQEGK